MCLLKSSFTKWWTSLPQLTLENWAFWDTYHVIMMVATCSPVRVFSQVFPPFSSSIVKQFFGRACVASANDHILSYCFTEHPNICNYCNQHCKKNIKFCFVCFLYCHAVPLSTIHWCTFTIVTTDTRSNLNSGFLLFISCCWETA